MPTLQRSGKAETTWRSLALLIVLSGAFYGTWRGDDDHWPFAPMAQFAFRTDPDSDVRAVYLQAITVEGERVDVPLTTGSVAMNRAEVEGQVSRFAIDPSKLRAFDRARHRLHPQDPAWIRIELRESALRLRNGRANGETHVLLAALDLKVKP